MKHKNNLVLMYIIVFLQGFVFYGPYATLYREDRGINAAEILLIEAIYMAFAILLEIPWGYIADKFGYKRTIIISNAVLMLSKIVFLYANSFGAFLFERFLMAVAFSGISGCDHTLIYYSIHGKNSTKVFGRYAAASTVGFLVASVVSSLIVKISLTATALFTIPPHILALLLSFFLADANRNRVVKQVNMFNTLKTALTDKKLILLAIFFSIFININQAVCVFLSQLKYEQIGINIAYLGLITAVIQISKMLSAKSHALERRVQRQYSLLILSCVTVVSVTVLIIIQNILATILSIIGVAVTVSMIVPIYAAEQNRLIDNENRATMLSCYAMIESVCAIPVYLLISWFSTISLELAFAANALLGIIGILILIGYNHLPVINKSNNI